MSGIPLIYEGVEFSLVEELRGWVAQVPRFGRTMYFTTQEDAVAEAVRLINAFLLPRAIRQHDRAA
jgi:hypothetical protein